MSKMNEKSHYGYKMLVDALRAVGIVEGDIVFSHVGIGMLGYPREGRNVETGYRVLKDALLEVIGKDGTWLVPTYSYSYCENEVYDPSSSPSAVGEFTNYFRKLPGAKRSLDPIFSVAGIGPRTDEIISDLPYDCFGEDCVYSRIIRRGAKICNIGVGFRYATFVHHVEQMLNVPYRFRKTFCGKTLLNGDLKEESWVYNVRFLVENSLPDLNKLEEQARQLQLVRAARVGLGEITCIGCWDMYNLCAENIKRDPWFLAAGPKIDLVETGDLKAAKEGDL